MKILRISAATLALFLFIRCSGTSASGPRITIAVKVPSSSGITLRDFLEPSRFFPLLLDRALTAGQNTAAGLTSLKYYIRNIQVCENLTVTGTAFSNPQNCFTIFERAANPTYDYTTGADYSALAGIARTDTTNFIDLVDATSRANLNASYVLQRANVRSYNWGVINWYPVVKFTSSVNVNNVGGATTSSYKTHDGTTSFVNGTFFRTTSTSNFTSGIAEEAVVVHTNGGSWFKFQSPLTIAASDIDSAASYVLDLAFNPEGLIKGFSSGVSTRSNVLRDASSNEMNIPFLELSPIPHKASETVTREAYTFDSTTAIPASSDNFNLRFDLYYITGESTKTIYAVEAKTLYRMVGTDASNYTTTDVSDFPKISYVTQNADGTLNFKVYDESIVIQNFTRKTTTGATGTATINCSATGWTFSGCSAGSSATMQYTLRSQGTL